MSVWIALLRAVNVGKANRLAMAPFRAGLAEIGLQDARTHLQSGNAVFRSDRTAGALSAAIADMVLARFGFRPPVLVLSAEALRSALAFCPFGTKDDDKVHGFFAERELPRAMDDFLSSLSADDEHYAWKGRVLWLYLPNGMARSRLARRVMALPVDITARNLRTLKALDALAAAEKRA